MSVDWIDTQICSDFPYTVQILTGTQAGDQNNKIYLMKWSELYSTQHDDQQQSSLEGFSDQQDQQLEGEEPRLDYIQIPHKGTVNRIRMQNQLKICSTYSQNGNIYIYNLQRAYDKLQTFKGMTRMKPEIVSTINLEHEGYGLCWSNSSLFGGGQGLFKIQYNGSSWDHIYTYTGHQGAVQDIQISPVEEFAVASCSTDKTVKVWDTRIGGTDSQITIEEAHQCDVNVISWNKIQATQICSGGDDGSVKVWDLRMTGTEIAGIVWHSDAVTSVCWNPIQATELAISAADDKVTVWDLAFESEGQTIPGVPSQLFFTHQGQEDIKEIIYHPQYQFILSTSGSSFNLFKPNIYDNK